MQNIKVLLSLHIWNRLLSPFSLVSCLCTENLCVFTSQLFLTLSLHVPSSPVYSNNLHRPRAQVWSLTYGCLSPVMVSTLPGMILIHFSRWSLGVIWRREYTTGFSQQAGWIITFSSWGEKEEEFTHLTLKGLDIHLLIRTYNVLFTNTDVTEWRVFSRNCLKHSSGKAPSYPRVPEHITGLLFFSLLSLCFPYAYFHIYVLTVLYDWSYHELQVIRSILAFI